MAILSGLAALSACAGAPDRGIRTTVEAGPVKIGKPYRIKGRLYTPRDDPNYRETGTASWYGPNFHGKSTANGERFDQNGISAAHRTLPLPSWVRVENLDNGREVTVRVNDRGPFAHNRIIDLSRRAAQLLDMQKAGVARVRVTRVYPDQNNRNKNVAPPVVRVASAPRAAAATVPFRSVAAKMPVQPAQPGAQRVLLAQAGGTPDIPLPSTTADTTRTIRSVDIPLPGALPESNGSPDWLDVKADGQGATTQTTATTSQATRASAADARMIQVAALSQMGSVVRLSAELARIEGLGPVNTEMTPSGLIRVRVGLFATVQEAERMLAKLKAAGYEEARLIAEPVS